LLTENGFVTEFRNVTKKNYNLLNEPDYSSQLFIALSHFHAPWSDLAHFIFPAYNEDKHIKMTRGNPAAPSFGIQKDDIVDWQQFHQFLLQRMNDKTAGDRMRYAKQYHSILSFGISNDLLQLSPRQTNPCYESPIVSSQIHG
jgi:hypothetical protein